jgi:hypothetical protein
MSAPRMRCACAVAGTEAYSASALWVCCSKMGGSLVCED